MPKPTTFDRNREIFAAFEKGSSVEQLAEDYGLTCGRVRAVLISERHKRTVSLEPFYQSLRGSAAFEPPGR
jgi:Mor family transcriptional regulator